MSEICLDCFNKESGREYTERDVLLDYDLCETCGEIKPCVIRFRRPLEKLFYSLGFRKRMLTDEELAAWQEEEDKRIAELMEEFAEHEGEKYNALNERLQNDPSAAVPADFKQKAVDLIQGYTKRSE